MTQTLSCLIILGWISPSFAQRFEPVTHPIGLAEKIIIRGYKGDLQVSPSTSDSITVEAEKKGSGALDRWTFQVRKKQNDIEIFVKGPSEQEDFEKFLEDKSVPPFILKVSAPVRPLEIFWAKGRFNLEKWDANVTLQITEGQVITRETKGALNIQIVEGRIDSAKHQGPMDIQAFKGQIILAETKGAISIDNHSASYGINEHEGPVNISSHSGSGTLTKISGNLKVNNVNGLLSLKEFSGSFEGEFSKGSLQAKLTQIQSFSVNSDEAAITLDVPKESGARVSLRSEKGRLWAPSHLQKVRKGQWTELRGRLKGKEQGNIKIISKYGDIVLK